MRTAYESPQDRTNEKEVIDYISMLWSCQCRKLPLDYYLDYAIVDPTDESIRALIEIKCRTYTIDQINRMGGYLLSLSKWTHAKQFCESSELPFLLVVRFQSEIWYFKTKDFLHDGLKWMKRHDMRDQYDMEPAVIINCSRFVKVSP